jgi:hypothetical protein
MEWKVLKIVSGIRDKVEELNWSQRQRKKY